LEVGLDGVDGVDSGVDIRVDVDVDVDVVVGGVDVGDGCCWRVWTGVGTGTD
jgi:hypothetical protein